MVLANIFNINDKSILATASITITDQTDAATLAGGISVVSGSKNQVYLTGSSSPFSPDWTKNNLVLRPYLYASSIMRATGTISPYNPDLFDPDEYPDLSRPGDNNVTIPYINTQSLHWYLRDANGVETLIDPAIHTHFDYVYTHNNNIVSDKRYLVIKDNFVIKDSFATIICKFSFYDPFAKIHINQNYEIDLSCLSTGLGANQLLINSINGTSIYNSFPVYIDLYTTYYKNGVEVNVQEEIESGATSSYLYWYIRTADGRGWTLLDGTKQSEYADLFEVRRYTSYENNTYITEPTTSNRGGFCLRIHPALINGSNVIKAVYYSSDEKKSYNALEIVYDTTDEIQAYIHSSNGDKIYQGINSIGTVLTCMLKYQGKLLDTNDPKYDTDFEYYWFKVSSDGTRTWNVWLDNTGKLMSQELLEESQDTMNMMPSSRILPINAENVDNVNMFQCAVIDKVSAVFAQKRSNYILNTPSEEDLRSASIINGNLGIEDDNDALLNTAYEINAFNISDGTSFSN